MTIETICVEEISADRMSVHNMSVDKMSVDEMSVVNLTCSGKFLLEIKHFPLKAICHKLSEKTVIFIEKNIFPFFLSKIFIN